ncbi:MAG: tyrosine-type recombinase/integrase [Actinomycetota bacterium]
MDAMVPGESLAGLGREWLDEKRTIGRGISAQTELAYRRDLTAWARAIAAAAGKAAPSGTEQISPFDAALGCLNTGDLDPRNVKRALASFARAEYAPATRARLLAALRGFCRWLVVNEHLVTDPTVHLSNPSIPDRLPAAFLPVELEAIVETVSQPDPTGRHPWPARDRALVAVLAGVGLRASECVGLKVADLIRDDPPLLKITGKANKQRRIPVPSEVLQAIDGYLAQRSERLAPAGPLETLFVRHNGLPFSREALNYHVYKWLLRAGVHKPEGEAAHAFRHTFAKGLVSNGVPLSSVQALLGHASLNTTQIYLRMTGGELADAMQATEVRRYLRDSLTTT